MAKVIKFPVPTPEKFGPERVRSKKNEKGKVPGQLDLFSSGRIIRLHQLTPFEDALLLDDRGNKHGAKAAYIKAIDEGDCIADCYCNLGILESQDGNTARAIDCFTNCLKQDPRHHEAHYNLANLYAEVGNFALAKVHYEIAIEIEPSFTNSYFNLGLTLAMIRQFKDAVKILDQYRKLSPPEARKQAEDLISKLSSF
jgi:tetratricopeptide (TPR) repeat protein